MVIYARKDFYLLDPINDKIEALKASGIINYLYFRSKKKNSVSLSKTTKVLSLKSLFGSFQLLFFGCFVSFSVFISEIAVKLIKGRTCGRSFKPQRNTEPIE
jgi:hypothetical protein